MAKEAFYIAVRHIDRAQMDWALLGPCVAQSFLFATSQNAYASHGVHAIMQRVCVTGDLLELYADSPRLSFASSVEVRVRFLSSPTR